MIQVKICGLSTPDTITTALENGADFIGLVFYPPSPRHVDLEVAQYLASFIPSQVTLVGLFVNPDDTLLSDVLDIVPLKMIQLHGEETPARVNEIKNKFNLPVMKALPIEKEEDLKNIPLYEGIADWFLFDSKGKTLPGGTGTAFDWTLLKSYKSKTPWMLAGGLGAENINQALEMLSPDALDVSSGVESSKGVKDTQKIQAFIQAAKKA
jgi:phosphoribosylanthranilate isomerase